MQDRGFELDTMTSMTAGTTSMIGHHRVTEYGEHNIISGIRFVNFSGVDTKEGDLGCVTLYYTGTTRKKYHRQSHDSEILKKAFCPKDAEEAIKIYDIWKVETYNTIQSWKVII
jgi:hypothetical protein